MDVEPLDLDSVVAGSDPLLAKSRSHEHEFVGLSELEASALATKLGLQLRVRHSDEEPLTLDLRASRMTVEVRDGSVAQAHAG